MVGVIKNKNTYLIYLFCLIIAAATITICSQSSPFYPLNTWVDPNCFLTVGKGIIHGLVPYRDLIEQKGPFLYFLHAGAALISETSFLGVWILEIIICSFFLYFSYRIIELYNKKLAIYFIPLIAVLCFTTPAFRMGDSAEELALPFITYALYVLLKSYKTKEEITNTQYFFVGLTAGCIFWSKFTLVGFYFGWFLGPLIHYIKNKNPKALLKSVLYIVFGIAVSTIPWIIYFGITHSISDFIDIYLVKNLTSYPLEKTDGQTIKILRVINGGIESAWRNNKANLIALGAFIPLAAIRKNFKEILSVLAIFITTFIFIYLGERYYIYYSFIFCMFMCLPLAQFVNLFKEESVPDIVKPIVVFFSAACVFSAYLLNPNAYMFKMPKENLPQYQFKQVIEETKTTDNPTLINYNFLDGGFYTACDILPNCKSFCYLNIDITEWKNMQRNHILDGKSDYVVIYTSDPEPYSVTLKNYEQVAEAKMPNLITDSTYYLYKLKGD